MGGGFARMRMADGFLMDILTQLTVSLKTIGFFWVKNLGFFFRRVPGTKFFRYRTLLNCFYGDGDFLTYIQLGISIFVVAGMDYTFIRCEVVSKRRS